MEDNKKGKKNDTNKKQSLLINYRDENKNEKRDEFNEKKIE